MSEVRTRFAPSPTGVLHIGGVRTALYSWLYARHHKGKLILRIEDTDQTRSTTESTQAILDIMKWLNIDYDEGPYYQSRRNDNYQKALQQLLDSEQAYYCDCTVERLASLREAQMAARRKPKYDSYCRNRQHLIDKQKPYVVRFKNPSTGSIVVDDQALGKVTFQNEELDDFILVRSDGSFTYNFTVVVDDYEMRITHVIRGNDHLNNTPRQLNVLKALGAPLPVYTHLPMLHSEQGKKLSKREDAASVMDYKEAGFLPEALINYLIRLGWSHGDQEIFSKREMTEKFDGTHLSKSPAVLNLNKLKWLNQHYLKNSSPSYVAKALEPFILESNIKQPFSRPLEDIVLLQRDRVKTLKDMAEKSRFFYENIEFNDLSLSSTQIDAFKLLYNRLKAVSTWELSVIQLALEETLHASSLTTKELFQALRSALTGAKITPPIDKTILALGQSRALERLGRFIA